MENNTNNFNAFLETISSMMENKDFVELLKQKKEQKQKELLTFTEKEIEKMPKTFRKEFRTDGCTARVYRRQVSKNAFTYDIMYRRNGYNVIVTDKNLENAKKRFIEKTSGVYTNVVYIIHCFGCRVFKIQSPNALALLYYKDNACN